MLVRAAQQQNAEKMKPANISVSVIHRKQPLVLKVWSDMYEIDPSN